MPSKGYNYTRKVISKGGNVLLLPEVAQMSELYNDEVNIDVYAQSSTQKFPLGTKLVRGDRIWRYTKNGATGLAIAVPVQSAAASHADSDDDIASGVAGVVGDTTVSLTGTTNIAVAANYYKEGYLIANDAGTGEGQCLKIKSHVAIVNAVECLINLYDPLIIATTTATQWGIRKNPFDSVIVTPGTTPTAMIAGVTPRAVTANYYFWLCTGGIAAVVAQAAIPVGAMVAAGTQAGKVASTAHEATYGIARTDQIIGFAYTPAIADTESFMVYLTLDR